MGDINLYSDSIEVYSDEGVMNAALVSSSLGPMKVETSSTDIKGQIQRSGDQRSESEEESDESDESDNEDDSDNDDEEDDNDDDDGDSEYASIPSYTTIEFERDIKKLFDEKEFYHVLILSRTKGCLTGFSPSSHLIVSISLFRLGRVGGALRELSLAIELETNPDKKEMLINFLTEFFEELGMVDLARACFSENLDLAKLALKRHQENKDQAAVEETDSRIKAYRHEIKRLKDSLVECVKGDSLIEAENMPIHKQFEKYIGCQGNASGFSIGRLCMTGKESIDSVIELLNNYPSKVTKGHEDPTFIMFDCVNTFGPLYIYEELMTSYKSLLIRALDDEMALHPEINYCMTPKKLVKLLGKWSQNNSTNTLITLCGVLVKHKLILGFISYYESQFTDAIEKFKWILNFFSILQTKHKGFLNKNYYLVGATQRVSILLLICCYMSNNTDLTKRDCSKLLAKLVQYDNISSSVEYLSGRLSQFFVCCAHLYEKLAFRMGDQILIELSPDLLSIDNDASVLSLSSAVRYEPDYLREMVRKLILAVAALAGDDSTDVRYYDRIIWGILMLGGVHLRTAWFFILVRNYFFIEHDYGPIHINECHHYRTFYQPDILGTYTNGWEIVDGLYTLVSEFSPEELDSMWDPTRGGTFLLPQMFESGGVVSSSPKRIVVADEYFDETKGYGNVKNFVQKSDFQIALKFKGHLKLSRKIVVEQMTCSKDLVTLWADAYVQHQGNIPEFIQSAINDL